MTHSVAQFMSNLLPLRHQILPAYQAEWFMLACSKMLIMGGSLLFSIEALFQNLRVMLSEVLAFMRSCMGHHSLLTSA